MFSSDNTLNDIEKEYSEKISLDHRKKFAQFFTPYPIADLMSKWVLKNDLINSVLDPAFGLGIFSRAIMQYNKTVQIIGFEIDKLIITNAKQHIKNTNVKVIEKDYMLNDWFNKYDGIICNPPYFKFHDYENKTILSEVTEHLSIKLSGFTNLYTLFLLKSIHQLKENGFLAYIIPSEFLNSDYGVKIKEYLIKSGTLRYIIVISFKENVFQDALTTACIVLCAKDGSSNSIGFINIESLDDLQKIEKAIQCYPTKIDAAVYYRANEIDANVKWRNYYQKRYSDNFKMLVPFLKYGKVSRGIATGSNSFFTFSMTKAKKHNIHEKYLLPCVCKSLDVKCNFFTKIDFEDLKRKDKAVYLLNAKDSLDYEVKKYLNLGIESGVDQKYLTSYRKPWYSLENRLPSPIWVSVFNRNGLRFIRNEPKIANLTTFHCVYPNESNLFHSIDDDLLFAYLLTDISKEILNDNQREYGNGLMKFEPNDINKGLMFDIGVLPEELKFLITKLYKKYRLSEINKSPDADLLKQIENIFVDFFCYC